MARARKSHDTDEEKVKPSRSRLKPAYAAKVGGNKFVVYCDLRREGEDIARVLVLNFAAEYAARAFILAVIHNDEWEWVDPIGSRKCIQTSTGVRVSMFGDDLKMLLEYEPTSEESEWTDERMKQSVLRFKYGQAEGRKKDEEEDDIQELEDGADETLSDNRKKKAKSKRREPRAPKEPKVKVDKSGYVSANEIAKDLKLEGREVRGILRSSDLSKPDVGWMWPKDSKELKEAKKIIEAGVKALAKKKGKK